MYVFIMYVCLSFRLSMVYYSGYGKQKCPVYTRAH